MIELIRKDVGICNNVLWLGMVGLFAPFAAYAIYAVNGVGLSRENRIELWSLSLLSASHISILLSMISVALLTGYIVAGERRDRTAEFLAYLPPSRNQVLISKFLVCCTWFALVVTVQIGVVDCFVPWLSKNKYAFTGDSGRSIIIATAICMFGASWLGSCFLESPTLAVLTGLVAPCGVYAFLIVLQLQTGWIVDDDLLANLIIGIFYMVGVLGVGAGWFYFIRRVEP